MSQIAPLRIAHRTVNAFLDDDVLTLSAALSFYTLLSFAPLMLLAVWASSAIGASSQDALLGQIQALAGNDARMAAQSVIDSVNKRPGAGHTAGIVGIVIALVGATGVFAQLQFSLNRIWNIAAKPSNAIWGWLRRRVLSIGVILATAFVLIVSLMVSSLLGLLLTRSGAWWDIINQLISAVVFAGLFAILFRYLPDARLHWRDAAWGGIATAILFAVGKWVIGFYLAHGSVGSAYGAAGSLVVLLVWVYYSSAIFFLGAEIVKAWLGEDGRQIVPAAHAERRPGE